MPLSSNSLKALLHSKERFLILMGLMMALMILGPILEQFVAIRPNRRLSDGNRSIHAVYYHTKKAPALFRDVPRDHHAFIVMAQIFY